MPERGEERRLFQRLGGLSGYVWFHDWTFHSSYDAWHAFGVKDLTDHAGEGHAPAALSERTPREEIEERVALGKALHIVARVSTHVLREERAYTVCRNIIHSVDPEGQHIVRPLELHRLPARDGHELAVAVTIFESLRGVDLLPQMMDHGEAWYQLELRREGDEVEMTRKQSLVPQQQVSLDRFFKFAIGAADCLEILHHGQRLVHGELRGDAFHMHPDTERVRLTVAAGSGLKTFEHGLTSSGWARLSQERGATTKLSFMAPEQTGRFNAQEDSRTDIYSFGIILWTLLAQRPAYAGTSPMDVLMAILGRRLPLTSEVRMDIPPAVARVIQKMTQKTIHERYHSISGVRHDLIQIRKLLEAGDTAGLQSFVIGTHDVSSFFVLPSAMLGRDREYAEIVTVIQRVADQAVAIEQRALQSNSHDGSTLSEERYASMEQELAASSAGSLRSSLDMRSNASCAVSDDAVSSQVDGQSCVMPDSSPRHVEGKLQSLRSNSQSIATSRALSKQVTLSIHGRSVADSLNMDSSSKGSGPGTGPPLLRSQSMRYQRRGRCEIITIAGTTGLGKTCLIQSVQLEARKRGYFASTKFDSNKTPFAAVLNLLSSLFKQVFSESNTSTPFHLSLKQYVRPAWPLLYKLLGLPENLLSDSPATNSSEAAMPKPDTLQNNNLLKAEQANPGSSATSYVGASGSPQSSQDFLRAGSSTKSLRMLPIYLDVLKMFSQHKFICFCLDDLQFADSESLDLLTALVASRLRMLLILTYRPEEVLPDKMTSLITGGNTKAGSKAVTRIVLQPLREDDISEFVSLTLHRPIEDVMPLVSVIQARSGGNPFYLRQMLDKCYRTSCIYFDFQGKKWSYDLDRISHLFQTNGDQATLDTDFIIDRLQELSSASRSILAWASFIGNSFSFEWVLRLMSGEFDFEEHCAGGTVTSRKLSLSHPKMEAIEGLQAAIEANILMPTQDDDRFRFTHDRYVQAAQSLKECNGLRMHYIIAQTLLKYYYSDARITESAAPHILKAAPIITAKVTHRQLFRKVLVDYADSLAEKNARPAAATFYKAAIALLQDGPWTDGNEDVYYDETLHLHIRAADCLVSIGNYTEAQFMIDQVLTYGKTITDQAFCYVLQSRVDCQCGKSFGVFRALEICLQRLGIKLPNRGSLEECDEAYKGLLARVRAIGVEKLLRWHPQGTTKSCDLQSIGAVITEASRASWWSSELDFYKMCLLHIEIYLEYGGFEGSCVGFMHLAVIALQRFDDCATAYEIGQISLGLMDVWKGLDIQWRTFATYSLFVAHVHAPIRDHLRIIERNLEQSFQQGDRLAITVIFGVVSTLKFFAGYNVGEIEAFCVYGCQEVDNWSIDTRGAPIIIANRQMCRALMGKASQDPEEIMSDETHDSIDYKQRLANTKLDGYRAVFFYEVCEMVPLFLYGHFAKAIEVGNSCLKRIDCAWSCRHNRFVMFIYALSLVGALWKKRHDSQTMLGSKDSHEAEAAKTLSLLKLYRDKIVLWQSVSDVNYLAWSRLLNAQILELENDHGQALLEIEAALDHASVHDFLLEEAIGNSLLASLFLRVGSRRPAKAALRDSIGFFRQLGAFGVVTHLEREHHLLLHEPASNLRAVDAATQTLFQDDTSSYRADAGRVGDEEEEQAEAENHRHQQMLQNTEAVVHASQTEKVNAWQAKGSHPEAGSNLPALDMLDLTAILESSQVMSSVLKVDDLLKTMCDIILQNCGGLATLATIITREDESSGYVIAASADQDKGAVAHIPGIPLKETALVVESVVLYSSRFREAVFVMDISQDERFNNEGSDWQKLNPNGKSIIAIPIQRGGQPMGVLYIEGLPNAFSDRNLTVLQLLVNQVGISLSNALVMKEVEKISAFNNSMVEIQRAALNKALRAEEKANAAKAAAEEAAKAKSIFLANVSHELRTPLNGVIGNSELLRDSDLRQDQLDMAESIRFSADLLLTVINDLLDFSKMEADKMKLFIVAFNADEMMREIVRSVSYSNRDRQAKGVEILSDIKLPTYLVFGDPVRLHQVLGNLISNSLKFTEQGSITVQARTDWEARDSVKLTFSVRDTGQGIPATELAKLFKPFSQADAKTNRKHGGSGLGLSICKSLIETMMGGTIELTSKEGVGTTCWFSLVLPKANPEAHEGDSQTELLNHDHEEKMMAGRSQGKRLGVDGIAKFSIPRSAMHIAIAEDNPINQKIAIQFVQKLGFKHIHPFDNGLHAVEGLRKLAKEGNPCQIILMDVQMPVMDGYEATQLIRKDDSPDVRGILVIAMTASAIQGDREKCISSGMNDYLAKPVRSVILKKKIDQYISSPMTQSESPQQAASQSTRSDGTIKPAAPKTDPQAVEAPRVDGDGDGAAAAAAAAAAAQQQQGSKRQAFASLLSPQKKPQLKTQDSLASNESSVTIRPELTRKSSARGADATS